MRQRRQSAECEWEHAIEMQAGARSIGHEADPTRVVLEDRVVEGRRRLAEGSLW